MFGGVPWEWGSWERVWKTESKTLGKLGFNGRSRKRSQRSEVEKW